jgi:hypothetical protein
MSDMGNWGWIAFWSVNAVTVVILVRCIVSESSWLGSSGDKPDLCANKKQRPGERIEDKES